MRVREPIQHLAEGHEVKGAGPVFQLIFPGKCIDESVELLLLQLNVEVVQHIAKLCREEVPLPADVLGHELPGTGASQYEGAPKCGMRPPEIVGIK